jgi:hypothetical protein
MFPTPVPVAPAPSIPPGMSDCFVGGKLLGYVSPTDKKIRLYNQADCSALNGDYVPNGECLRKGGGSISAHCGNLNPA